ncbi:MAG: TonB-dependent receptor [Bacteroidota bacterium]|nr:TonB-dependent receptor [Bacteroidota bacterium]
MKKVILLIPLLLLNCIFAPAQEKGILRGKITDSNTGEELIGATVAIPATGGGSITDFDGNFSISLEPGTYAVVVSYISYETQQISEIQIIESEVQILNARLTEATTQLEEVQVVARFRKKTEAAMQIMQRRSASIINGISSSQMSDLGDSNAAAALKRVTGISVENGKYVYVRGLGDRYTKTTLNGADIPSLDPNKNTVQMDMFPSNLIENIVVYKTFSPMLPGDFTGGYVNITTRDFPEKLSLSFSTSAGYNPQVHLRNDFLGYEGGKLDWIGMDDGSRDIPSIAQEDIPAYAGIDNPALDMISSSFNKNMSPLRKTSLIDQSHSLSFGNQYLLGEKALGFIASITYKNEFKFYDDGETGSYQLIGSNSESLNTSQQLADSKGTRAILWGAMFGTSLKLNNANKIGLNFLRNQSGESSARYQEGLKPSDDIALRIQERTLQYLDRGFTNAQLKGEHYFENLRRLKIDWIASYTHTQQKEPDLRFFNNDYKLAPSGDTIFSISPNLYTVPTRYYRTMSENNATGKTDGTLPFTFLGAKAKFQFGGNYVYKSRNSSERNFDIRDQNQSYNGIISDYLNNSNIGASGAGTYGVYVNSSKNTEGINSYYANQEVASAYAMVDMLILNKLRMVTGVRLETTNIFIENLVSKDHYKYKQANVNNQDILPSLNLSYSLQENMNLRFAASRTIARPVFRELAPYAFYDFLSGRRKIGNPDLERSLIDNLDLRYEYFFAPGEMISFSAFYKHFTNPIEQVDNPQAVNAEITFQNADFARLLGIEAEFRKNLDFIPALKNFSISLNAALIQSKVSIDSLELLSIRATDPDHGDFREMYAQAPYILNAVLQYHNKDLGLRSSLSFNVSGEKLYLVVKGGTPDVYDQPFPSLNFNISKKIGKQSAIKLSIKNILNTSHDKSYIYRGESYVFERYTDGRAFSLGYSFTLK